MNTHPKFSPRGRGLIRRILKASWIVLAGIAVLCLAASAWYVNEFYPRRAPTFEVNSPELASRILIATQGSEFKNGLVTELSTRLAAQPAYVKVIDVGGLDDVDTDAWSRIVVINTVMFNALGRDVRAFIDRTAGNDDVLLFFTSGGADYWPRDLKVDAVSGASPLQDIGRLAGLIQSWLGEEDRSGGEPRDDVLAMEYYLELDVDAACASIQANAARNRDLYPDLEHRLNRVGYRFVKRGRLERALTVFRLNRDLHPESWNVYDSYAEALLAHGDWDEALVNYQKSYELNPDQKADLKGLKELKAG